MPQFRYTGKTQEGKTQRGTANAADIESLYADLKGRNIYVTSAHEAVERVHYKKLKPKQLSTFFRSISVMVGDGISILRALQITAEDESIKPAEAKVYEVLQSRIRQGTAMSDAMEELGIFPNLAVSMIRGGETSGKLAESAARLADNYQKEYKLNAKIKSATTYPKLLCALIVVAVGIIMYYVMPKFQFLFDMMDELPAATLLLMNISDFVKNRWYVLIIAVVLLVFLIRFLKNITPIRYGLDQLKVKLPVIGKLEMTIYSSRFARALSSLYGSGVPIVSALNIAQRTIGNTFIESQFAQTIAFISGGGTLSDGLDRIVGFVKKLSAVVRVGEESGSLENMLDSVADTLEYESENAITKLTSMLEPLLIVVMAVVVGYIMVAVMVPVFNSYGAIENY